MTRPQQGSLGALTRRATAEEWNPKRSTSEALDGLFPYYAGFPRSFAQAVLKAARLPVGSRLLDPWNGAGTTTLEASSLGFRATGIDLNPVAAMAASAKLANRDDASNLSGLALDICRTARDRPAPAPAALHAWLPPAVARHHWSIQTRIKELLATPTSTDPAKAYRTPPPIASFLIICLLRASKSVANVRRSTNPSWFRPAEAMDATTTGLDTQWLSNIQRFAGQLRSASADHGQAEIIVQDSRVLPVEDGAFDFVLTSPPYCTRFDYVANTAFELAALGLYKDIDDLAELRRASMGTPLTREREAHEPDPTWPADVRRLLNQVRRHPSADSSGYYYKNHWQYFRDASKSLGELRRALAPRGRAVLVLQTSYYKDVFIDLPELYRSIARTFGFRTTTLRKIKVERVMTQINSRALRHLERRSYTEAVIGLQAE